MALDDYEMGWWRHVRHRREVSRANDFQFHKALERGRRAFARSELLRLAFCTVVGVVIAFLVAWLAIWLSAPIKH